MDAQTSWNLALLARPSLRVVAADTSGEACLHSISYRVAGLAGILLIALGFWAVIELGSMIVHGVSFGLRRSAKPTENGVTDTAHRRGVARIEIGHEAHRRRARSRVRLVSTLTALCGLMLLLPSTLIFIFFVLFSLILLLVIAFRDLMSSGYWQTQGNLRINDLDSIGSGPPLFTDSNQRNMPIILGVLWPGLGLLGGGLLFSWVAGGTVVCNEPGKAQLTLVRFAIGASFTAAGFILICFARWASIRRSADLLASDKRPPVLYLRSFSDDKGRIRTDRWTRRTIFDRFFGPVRERFEQIVTWHLWSYGPVVAIRKPGGSRQPIGAAREELDGDKWKYQIDEWLVSARLVSMTLGRTVGLQWEINRIRELGLHEKFLVLFPPVCREELADRWREFQQSWEPGSAATPLPNGSTHVLAAVLSGPGGTTIITSYRRDEASYRMAIMTAAHRLQIAPQAWNLTRQRQAGRGVALPEPLHHPAMQGRMYYLALTDKVIGPFGKMQLRRMAADRQITPSTLVSTEGQPWIPISHIPGVYSTRSRRTAIALAFFGGILGMDRFYLGRFGTGLAKMITMGGLGVWWLFDIIGLGARLTTDVDGLPLRK